MARRSIQYPWMSGPSYGSREPDPVKSPERLARLVHERCKRNAVHLYKTGGWVIDVGRIKSESPTRRTFDITGFTTPVRGSEGQQEIFEVTVQMTFVLGAGFELKVLTDSQHDIRGHRPKAPAAVLRCVESTFNELQLSNEAQLARARR